ncbi:Deoxynucleoside triphosphate triphosphohydrolase SAMHD1-like 2 [Homarus americanus]|uniref:Deoxynucleoside triphosphate triphosphohydrolase SAMHD1-like 2 n=1 Tax=Homarus americanus TaxID=6706 RepID=A0A8J5N6M7_HOMAM|nr:Deoxynucleoside triphosphate triphosphohydrolase SAMHD1-like 2 [Homarus americanus]
MLDIFFFPRVCHLAGELIGAIKTRQPELKIQDEDVLCVQIAGLCHDLGHGPFSHLWEEFVNEARPGKKWKKYKLGDKDKKFIRELIGGAKSANGIWPYEGLGKEKAFLYEVVANKRTGVDVDKWDYFVRDSYSFGMKVSSVPHCFSYLDHHTTTFSTMLEYVPYVS